MYTRIEHPYYFLLGLGCIALGGGVLALLIHYELQSRKLDQERQESLLALKEKLRKKITHEKYRENLIQALLDKWAEQAQKHDHYFDWIFIKNQLNQLADEALLDFYFDLPGNVYELSQRYTQPRAETPPFIEPTEDEKAPEESATSATDSVCSTSFNN